MDTQFTPEINAKKKPFAFASITLIFTAFLVLGKAFSPFLNSLSGRIPLSQLVSVPNLVVHAFLILAILCVAAATFFKKSNVFLIISLFAVAIGFAVLAFFSVSSLIQVSTYPNYPEEIRRGLIFSNVLYAAEEICFVLGFITLGITAILARMGKTKETNLWILASFFFLAAVIVGVAFVGKSLFGNFDYFVHRFEMLLNGWGSFTELFTTFLITFCPASIFFGNTVMNLINSILLGTYLKKLSK